MIADYTSEWIRLAEELMDGIDNGDFSDYRCIPNKYKWKHMEALYYLKDVIEGGAELYSKLYDIVIAAGKNRIKQISESGKKVNITFQSFSAAQWPAEYLYKKFEQCEECNVQIFVSPLALRDKETYTDTYRQTFGWFISKGYNVVGGLSEDNEEFCSWEDLDYYPDILYLVSSWYDTFSPIQQFIELPITVLIMYIPYGMYLIDNESGNYMRDFVYNKDITNMTYRLYCDLPSNYEGYRCNQFLGGKNVRCSGYAKMDFFYNKRNMKNDEIEKLWSIPNGKKADEVKKVIIAPHHSIGNDKILNFSTFDENIWFLLYLTKKYKDRVSFIIKPHPNLRNVAVNKKLFRSYKEYDDFFEEWNALPNVKVVQEAGYLEYFDTSDAMILDSCSFIAEYLYTQKPLLLLTRPEQNFLEIGKKVLETYYRVPGNDYYGIEEFLQNIVLDDNDYLLGKRSAVFAEEFDYYKNNGMYASDYIYYDFKKLINA